MTWTEYANQVIGRPYQERGWDCWGLVAEGYRRCLGVQLHPAPDREVEMVNWQLVDREAPGDVALFRPLHVGLIIAPGRMLHVARGVDTCVERLGSIVWRHRLLGIYRYAGPGAC